LYWGFYRSPEDAVTGEGEKRETQVKELKV
jgi:hypothetical protein